MKNSDPMNDTENTTKNERTRLLFSGDRVLWVIVAVLAVISVLVVYS